ncbi:MAG: LURP-one-related/scramblase family protein, partial [Pseudolactococcus laudensis]
MLKTSHSLGGVEMVQYQIKQNFWSLGGKFKIMDNAGNLAYLVQGSFMKIQKQFNITKPDWTQKSQIKKVMFQIFPKFDVT